MSPKKPLVPAGTRGLISTFVVPPNFEPVHIPHRERHDGSLASTFLHRRYERRKKMLRLANGRHPADPTYQYNRHLEVRTLIRSGCGSRGPFGATSVPAPTTPARCDWGKLAYFSRSLPWHVHLIRSSVLLTVVEYMRELAPVSSSRLRQPSPAGQTMALAFLPISR